MELGIKRARHVCGAQLVKYWSSSSCDDLLVYSAFVFDVRQAWLLVASPRATSSPSLCVAGNV